MPLLDLIGIGSINEDLHSLGSSKPPKWLSTEVDARRETFLEGSTASQMSYLIGELGRKNFTSRCGGSAFNVIQTVKNLHLNLALGFVGIAGTRDAACDFRAALTEIDTAFCHVDDSRPPGRCLAYGTGNNCSLFTDPGANAGLVEFLEERNRQLSGTDDSNEVEPLVAYLARARWIHLTSFVDRRTLFYIVGRIKKAKTLNPLLRVSFDPGDEYTHKPSPEVIDACTVADCLFLNRSEFRNLGLARGRGLNVAQIADRIFSRTSTGGQLVVLKNTGSNFLIHRSLGKLFLRRYWHHWLPGLFIADDIGAGDVFAGGFIAGHLVPLFKGFGRGPTELGARLAWTKLRRAGIPFEELGSIAIRAADRTLHLQRNSLRDLISTWLPPLARHLLSGFLGALIGFIVRSLVER